MPPPRKITILPDFGMSLFPTGDFSNEIVKPDSRIITYKQDDPTGGIHGDILDPTGNEGGIFGDILKPGPFNDRITPDLNSDDPRSGWPGQGYGLGYDEWGDPYTPNGYLAMLDEMKRRRLEEEKERNKEHLNWPVEKKPGYKKYTYDVNYDTDNKFGIKVERDLPCLEEIKEALDSIYYMLFKQSNWGDILPSDDPDHDHNSGHTIMEKFLKLGGCSSALLDFVNCMTGNESKFQETIKSITGDKNNISAEVDENKYAGKYDSNTGNMWINCKAI